MGKTFVRIYQNKCQITALYQSYLTNQISRSQLLSGLSNLQQHEQRRPAGPTGRFKEHWADTGPTTVRHFVF